MLLHHDAAHPDGCDLPVILEEERQSRLLTVTGDFSSQTPGILSRDNGDIFLQLFPSWLCHREAKKPRHEVITCLRRESKKESHGSIVFALLRIIFSLQFPLLIANFSSFSKSHSTSALSPSPTRAGASRNCHRWAKEKHTCLFLIYLESSSFLVLLGWAAARLFWPCGWGLSPEDWSCRGDALSQSKPLCCSGGTDFLVAE